MKIYIAGKITGDPNYRAKFAKVEEQLKAEGYTVMNPAVLPDGFEHHEYISICFAMIDACNWAYFLNDWTDSKGAKLEHEYAIKNSMAALYQREENYEKE